MKVRPIRIEGDTAFIPLTQGYEAIIDAADVGLVEQWNWYALVAPHTVYAIRRDADTRRTVYLHRALLNAPASLEVDHVSCDGLDNRRTNIRLATASQNQHNKRIHQKNASGFKGVSWHASTKKWRARICLNKKSMHLGVFPSADLAHQCYAAACAELHGDFGRLA